MWPVLNIVVNRKRLKQHLILPRKSRIWSTGRMPLHTISDLVLAKDGNTSPGQSHRIKSSKWIVWKCLWPVSRNVASTCSWCHKLCLSGRDGHGHQLLLADCVNGGAFANLGPTQSVTGDYARASQTLGYPTMPTTGEWSSGRFGHRDRNSCTSCSQE